MDCRENLTEVLSDPQELPFVVAVEVKRQTTLNKRGLILLRIAP